MMNQATMINAAVVSSIEPRTIMILRTQRAAEGMALVLPATHSYCRRWATTVRMVPPPWRLVRELLLPTLVWNTMNPIM